MLQEAYTDRKEQNTDFLLDLFKYILKKHPLEPI